MQNLNIKTHKPNKTYTGSYFFILSKGNNAGKPLDAPCPNCFVCQCKDEAEKQRLYWLFYGLWQGMYFYPVLTGSVIPFIRLDDLKEVAQAALAKIELKPLQFNKNVSLIQILNQQAKIAQEQVKLIKQAKRALMYQVLK